MNVRPALPDDAIEIAYIYNHYVATSHATLEVEPIDGAEMLRRMEEGWLSGYPFLVADVDGEINGYAYGRSFSPQYALLHSVEISCFVRPGYDGQGVGTRLYDGLLKVIRAGNFHAVIAGISLPHDSAVRLHEKFGFERAAHFREVGRKFDRWIDVAYWELVIDK